MNKLLVSTFLFIATLASAQTAVDKVIDKLELLSNASFDNWKYSVDMSLTPEEISRPDYNEKMWEQIKIDDRVYPEECWLRKEIVLPKFIGGELVSGKLNFLVSVDDYGFLYVNGQEKGRFNWSGEFKLSENAEPGQKFIIVIKAVNTGGPLRLLKAQLKFEEVRSINNLVSNFILSLKTGQKLLGFDTYQTNSRVKVDPGIDNSKTDKVKKKKLMQLLNEAVAELNIDALNDGQAEEFLESLDKVKAELKPVAEFAEKFTLHFTANAHIDAAWLWRKKETVDVAYHTFSSVMNMFEARTDNITTNFAYSQSQAVLYEWMMDFYPDLFNQIKEKVKLGNWEVVGGMWVEPDCNLIDGVSWSRQLLYGQKFFEKNIGKKAVIGWNPDSFGYNWNMPMFFINSGIDVFITQKIGWNDTNVFPHRVFWWEAADGSRILSYFPFSYVNDISNPFRIIDWLRQFESNTGFTNMLVLFGIGNHGGGPSIEMMKKIDALNELLIFPKITYGTAEEYLTWLKTQNLEKIPVWKDELYLEYHRGTLTTQSDIKKGNRTGEALLTNAEKFAAIASMYDETYPKDEINSAWKKILFNQFHDILPGSCIREVVLDADKDYNDAIKLGDYALKKSLKIIADNIDKSIITNGEPLVIFNPLSWKRTDIVKFMLPEGDDYKYEIYDNRDNKVESQMSQVDDLTNEIVFIAEDVPAIGYKTYSIKRTEELNESSKPAQIVNNNDNGPPKVVDASIENEFFKVTIDAGTGWIKSIMDKSNKKEILSDYGNRIQLLEDKPSDWDAWNIGLTGLEYPYNYRKMEFVEQGPVKTTVRVYFDYLKPGTIKEFPTEDFPNSFFSQDIILYKGIDRVDFKIEAEWFEEKTMMKVIFPVTVYDTAATYEIPYGTIQRSTTLKSQWDKGKWEVAALRWADLSDGNYGVSLLNKAKYGYDIKGSNIRLSILRSPKWPDETADMHFHKIEYSLYPHAGSFKDAETIKRGYEYNNNLIAAKSEMSEGKLPLINSFVQVNRRNVIVTSIKQAEDNESEIIYQFYETDGQNTEVKLTLHREPAGIEITNFLEETGKKIPYNNKGVVINIKANSVVTLKAQY
ncbi:MAG: alpha-mannosidase [Melioribacteraceae bacterium]|nr:alpha-mannosidase [Melioribacteraceae bacterium]